MSEESLSVRSEQRAEYIARVNRVMDYVEQNIDRKLTLDEVAGVASFSPYHFHRVFGALVGETLGSFIQRVRVEKAASLLVANRGKSITEIALDCGFSGSATFARAFKETFDMSASQWRSGGYNSTIRSDGGSALEEALRAIQKHDGESVVSFTIDQKTRAPQWQVTMYGSNCIVPIEVRDRPSLNVAYVRHIGPYQGMADVFTEIFDRLMRWAQPRDLIQPNETQVLSVYHDDPIITDDAKLRVDACITVPEGTIVEGEVGTMVVHGGRYAIGRFELGVDEYSAAWSTMFAGWMPESGYQPDEGLCYELFQSDSNAHPERKAIVDICIPVKPL